MQGGQSDKKQKDFFKRAQIITADNPNKVN